MAGKKRERPDSDYEIESLTKGLIVLEALEGSAEEPLELGRLMERTGFSRDLTMRILRTLRLKGYAIQRENKRWSIGGRIGRFARDNAL